MTPRVLTPRCPVWLASRCRDGSQAFRVITILLLFVTMGAAASRSTAAEESDVRLVGPPRRLQLRPSNETRTPQHPSAKAKLPLRVAAQWRTILDPAGSNDNSSSIKQEVTREPQIARNPASAVFSDDPPPAPPELPLPTAQDELSPAEVVPLPPQERVSPSIDSDKCAIQAKRPLSFVQANIALPEGSLPADVAQFCAAESVTWDPRLDGQWAQFDLHWAATCLCHKPLYFEQVNVERYGYTVSRVLQPAISGAQFFLTIPALPYKMVVQRPCDCIYELGYYRPGDCVPRRYNRLPLRIGAAAVEVGTIAGLILLIP